VRKSVESCPAHHDPETVNEKVVVCMMAPDVAVTVTVAVDPAPFEDAPLPPPQPANKVSASAVAGSISSDDTGRRRLTRMKSRPIESSAAEADVAVTVAALTVSVETMFPFESTAGAAKVQVAPLGSPEHVNFTAVVDVNPFWGVTVIAAVVLEPTVTASAPGAIDSVKSGDNAPLLVVDALA
jgi:hypothetical protein